jgi:hypothetical protein
MARQRKIHSTTRNAQGYGHLASDLPAWLLDIGYNGMMLRARQAFFPRTSAGEHKQIAVKVIDSGGNELLVFKELEEGK